MSQKNPQELQKMVEDLQKDVDALNRYVRTIQTTLAKANIKVPPFKGYTIAGA